MQQRLFSLAKADPLRMAALAAVRDMDLPDCWIGAGFVRAMVWDHLSGYVQQTPVDDVDVIYFDPAHTDEGMEKEYDARLKAMLPGIPWSCKNQARMHLKFGRGAPYIGTEDGLRHWLETPTAVALRMDGQNALHLLAPFGLDDLFNMRIAPTPYAREHKPEQYLARARAKPWRKLWPRLVLVGPDGKIVRD
jgi:hypothetical protein